jgi:hypothetical protein
MSHARKSRQHAIAASDPSQIQAVNASTVPLDQCKVGEVIRLSPADFLTFWNALQEKPSLTPAQLELAMIMRGDE